MTGGIERTAANWQMAQWDAGSPEIGALGCAGGGRHVRAASVCLGSRRCLTCRAGFTRELNRPTLVARHNDVQPCRLEQQHHDAKRAGSQKNQH